MGGGERQREAGRGRRRALVLTLAALFSLAAVAPAVDAKKKKKKKAAAVTKTASVSLASGVAATGTASCTGKTHATGGGFSIAPSFAPPSTGLRSITQASNPVGGNAWTAAGSAFSNPAASGSLTTYARCEQNSAGRIAVRTSSQVPIGVGAGQNMVFNCPPGTHVISGGYSGTGITSFTYAPNAFRLIVLQSRRTGPGQWTISAFNNPNGPGSTVTLTGYAVCEFNAKGSAISEVSTFAPISDNARAAADSTCGKKSHVVSGGFLASPAVFPGDALFVSIDETQPVGTRAWHVGLHELVGFPTPTGAALQTVAYCKKG